MGNNIKNMKFFALALIGAATAMTIRRDDLPHGPKDDSLIDKIDPLSRYVNDDDILQLKSQNLVQLNRDDLPHGPKDDSLIDKIDPLSRYVNDMIFEQETQISNEEDRL